MVRALDSWCSLCFLGLVLLASLGFTLGCGGQGEEPDEQIPAEIEVSPQGPLYLKVGEVITLSATVSGPEDERVRWENSRRSVAFLDGDGQLEAREVGFTRLSARAMADTNAVATIDVFVEDPCEEPICIVPREAKIHPGGELVFQARGSGTEGLSWSAQRGTFTEDGLYIAPGMGSLNGDEEEEWEDPILVDRIRAESPSGSAEVEVEVRFWVPVDNGELSSEARIQKLLIHPLEKRLYLATSEGGYSLDEGIRALRGIRDTLGGLPNRGISSFDVDEEGAMIAVLNDVFWRPPGEQDWQSLRIGNQPYGAAFLKGKVYGARRGDDDNIYVLRDSGEWEEFVSLGHRVRSMHRVGAYIYARNHGPHLVRFDESGNLEEIPEVEAVVLGPNDDAHAVVERRIQRFSGGSWVDIGLEPLPGTTPWLNWTGESWVVRSGSQIYRLMNAEWVKVGPPISGEGGPSRTIGAPDGSIYTVMTARDPLNSNNEIHFGLMESPPGTLLGESNSRSAAEVRIQDPPYTVLREGTELPLRGEVHWADGTVDYALHWLSTNPGVASVDREGRVQAHREGTTEIRARARGDHEIMATVEIQVVQSSREPAALYLDPPEVQLFEGEEEQLSPQIEVVRFPGALAGMWADFEIQWTVEDSTIATVDSQGLVKALRGGQTLVRAQIQGFPAIQAEALVQVRTLGEEE